MKVRVVPILDTEFKPARALSRVMNDRLLRAAKDLQEVQLKSLSERGFAGGDLVIYISYSPKYQIRYRIVNEVPSDIDYFLSELCARLGYNIWKNAAMVEVGIR